MTFNQLFNIFNGSFQPLSRMFTQVTTGCSPQCSSSWLETWSAPSVFCSTCPPCLSLPSSGQPGFMPLWVHLPLTQGNMSVLETRLYLLHRQSQFSPFWNVLIVRAISTKCGLSYTKRKWCEMCGDAGCGLAAPESFGFNHVVQNDTFYGK